MSRIRYVREETRMAAFFFFRLDLIVSIYLGTYPSCPGYRVYHLCGKLCSGEESLPSNSET
jgi:hypothetical protein